MLVLQSFLYLINCNLYQDTGYFCRVDDMLHINQRYYALKGFRIATYNAEFFFRRLMNSRIDNP